MNFHSAKSNFHHTIVKIMYNSGRKSVARKSLTSDFCEHFGYSIPTLGKKTAFIPVINIVVIFRIYKIVKLYTFKY